MIDQGPDKKLWDTHFGAGQPNISLPVPVSGSPPLGSEACVEMESYRMIGQGSIGQTSLSEQRLGGGSCFVPI